MNSVASVKSQNITLLKQAIRTAEQTNQMAIDVNVELHGQEQKMVGMDLKLNKINNTLDKSEETAKQINSYWYYLKNKVKKAIGIKKESPFPEFNQENQVSSVNKESFRNYQEKEINFLNQLQKSRDEEDELADQLLLKIRQIKGHSKATGEALDRQNAILVSMDSKAQRATGKMQKIGKVMNKILRR